MKKVLAVLCLILMIVSLCACGNKGIDAPDNSFNSKELEAFVEANEDKLIEQVVEGMGFDGDVEVKVEGKGIVFDVKTSIFDNASEEIKLLLQEQASAATEEYDEIVEQLKEEENLEDLEYISVTFRDSKGTFMATATNR